MKHIKDCSTCQNAVDENPDISIMEFAHTPCAKCKQWEPDQDRNTVQMPEYWWNKCIDEN